MQHARTIGAFLLCTTLALGAVVGLAPTTDHATPGVAPSTRSGPVLGRQGPAVDSPVTVAPCTFLPQGCRD
jgi:hypothetical protein